MRRWLVAVLLCCGSAIGPAWGSSTGGCSWLAIDARLAAHCHAQRLRTQTLTRPDAIAIIQRLRAQGIATRVAGLEQSAYFSRHRLSPFVGWSDNLNGGNARDSLTLGTMALVLDPERARISGPEVGVQYTGALAYPVTDTLAARGSASVKISQGRGEITRGADVRGCLDQQLGNHALMGCVDARGQDQRWSESHDQTASVTLTRFVHARLSIDATASALRGDDDSAASTLAITLNTLGPKWSTRTRISAGHHDRGDTPALKRGVSFDASRTLATGRGLQVSLDWRRADGGQVLGVPYGYRDRAVQVGWVDRRWGQLSLGWLSRASDIDYFRSHTPSLRFSSPL